MIKDIIICDLDGTLIDSSERRGFLESTPPNFKSFFDPRNVMKDRVIEKIHSILIGFVFHGFRIVFITGRGISSRPATLAWLNKNLAIGRNNFLYFDRPSGNLSDAEAKRTILSANREFFKDRVYHAFEDNPECAEMYTSLGIETSLVGDPGAALYIENIVREAFYNE